MVNEELLSIQEAAKILKVSTKTLRRWEGKGVLVPQRTDGNHRRYTASQIKQFAHDQKEIQRQKIEVLIQKTQDSSPFVVVEKHSQNDLNIDPYGHSSKNRILFVTSVALFSFVLLFTTIFSAAVFNKSKGNEGMSKFSGSGKNSVLAVSTGNFKYLFRVNIPSSFSQNAEFLSNVDIAGQLNATDGIDTANSNINAGTGTLTASNVIYGITAGSGISVSAGQTPTIANTGVLSIGGQSGAVSLTAGTGISISGTTITNTQTQADSFKNILIGSDTITASSATDTLTIAAGTGITLGADTGTKTLTINSTATGGSAATGSANRVARFSNTTDLTNSSINDLYPSGVAITIDSSGNLGVGTTTPTGALDVAGTASVSGAFKLYGAPVIQSTANQTLALGGDTTGNISINPLNGAGTLALNLGQLTVNGNSGITEGSPSCVTVTNGIVTGTGVCQLGSEQWTVSGGAIYTGNPSLDLLLGSTATSTAKFAFINVSGGTPTASISGTGNNKTYLTGSGELGTTNAQTLTLGGSTTGNIVLDSGSGSISLSDNTSITGTLGVSSLISANGGLTVANGQNTTLASFTSKNSVLYATETTGVVNAATTNSTGLCLVSGASAPTWTDCAGATGIVNYWTQASGALTPINSTQDFLLGGQATTSATFAVTGNSLARGNQTATLSGSLVLDSAGSLTTTNKQKLTIGGGNTGEVALGGFTAGVVHTNASGVLSTGTVTNAELANSSLTVTAGTGLSGGGAVSLGGSVTLNNAGVLSITGSTGGSSAITGALTLNNALTSGTSITIDNAVADGATKGIAAFNSTNFSASSGVVNTIQNINTGATPTFAGLTLTPGFVSCTALTTNGSGNVGCSTLSYATGTNWWTTSSDGKALTPINNTMDVLFGGNSSASAALRVVGQDNPFKGTLVAASVSANTSFAGLVVDNKGVGDIFTASAAGTSRFTVGNKGDITANYNNTADATNTAFSFTNTINPGSIGSANRTFTNQSLTFTPTVTFSHTDAAGRQFVLNNSSSTLSLTNVTLGDTGPNPLNFNNFSAIGSTNTVSGTPTLNQTTGNAANFISAYGVQGAVSTTLAITSLVGGTSQYNTYGGQFTNSATSPGNALLDSLAYGIKVTSTGNLTTTSVSGANAHYGGHFQVSGTADNNYGLYVSSVATATNNYGLYINTVAASSGNYAIYSNAAAQSFISGNLGIGSGATAPTGTLDVRTNSSSSPIATVSGSTSGIGLTVDQSGAGDLFSAAVNGQPKFTVLNNGNINIYGANSLYPVTLAVAGTNQNRTITFPNSTGTVCLDSNNCSFAYGNNWWTTSSDVKAVTLLNNSMDLLIGGPATTSATFAILNNSLSRGSQVATLSGDLVLDKAGSLQTTRNQGLTLGGSTTGNITLSPLNGITGSFIAPNTNNQVDLGTSSLAFRNIYAGSDVKVGGVSVCLSSGTNCPAGAVTYWTQSNGSLYPNNSTLDLLFGGQSTASAKFHLYGDVNSGTQAVASIAANSSFAGLVLSQNGSGDVFTASSSGQRLLALGNKGALTFYPVDTTTYSNSGGTGDRTSIITVTGTIPMGGSTPYTKLVDGLFDSVNWFNPGGTAVAGYYIQFDFGVGNAKRITEAKFYQSSGASHGSWKWQGSNNGSSWTDIGSAFTLGNGLATQTQTELANNTNLYRYYRILGVSGTDNSGPWIREFEFKLNDVAGSAGAIVQNDSIGVGTLTPTVALDVVGRAKILDAYSNLFINGGNGGVSGTNNVGVGPSALSSLTIGQGNSALGNGVLSAVTTGGANTAFGLNAGNTVTVGGSNTLLGYNSDTSLGNLINATAIGANAYVSQSDSLILGSINGVNSATGSAKVGIGTTAPLLTFDVRGGSGTLGVASFSGTTSFASLISDNSGVGDLFTASKGGQTKFTLLNNGNINVYGVQNIPTTLAFSATGAQTITFPDATGTVCISTNNCGYQPSGSYLTADQYWTTSSDGKALTPINSTLDLLIGGNATTSATFAITGNSLARGNQTATLSGSLVLDSAGSLTTTNKQKLTIGGGNTGEVALGGFTAGVVHTNASGVLSTGTVTNAELQNSSITVSNGTGIGVSGSPVSLGGTVTISNTGVLSITGSTGGSSAITGALTLNNALTSGTTITIDNAVADGATKGIAAFNSTNFSASSGVVNTIQNINTGATPTFAGLTLTPGFVSCTALTTNGSGNVGCSTLSYATGTNWWTTSSDGKALTPINSTQDLLIGGNATTSAVFGVLGLSDINHQTTATVSGNLSVNPNNGFGGNITATGTINGLTITNNGANTLNIAAGKTLTVSNSLTLAGTDGKSLNIGANNLTFTTSGDTSLTLPTSGTVCVNTNNCSFATGTNWWTTSNGSLFAINSTLDTLLGGNSTSSAAFKVTGQSNPNAGTLVAASVSANTSFAGTVITQNGSGDLFTASKGGQTKFTILNNGNINAYGVQNIPTTLAFSATGAQTITFPDATGTVCISTNNCGYQVSGSYLTADQYWTTSTDGKALTPINSTQDLLIGGNATTSAKFALIGLNGTSPVASISAQNAGASAIYLDPANNAIQTVKGQSLNLGGTTTGNVNILNKSGVAFATFNTANSGLYLGAEGSLNGSITFYSSGGATAPSIYADSSKNLNITAPSGTLNLGSGTGDITIDPGANNAIVDLTSTGDFQIRDNGTPFSIFDDTAHFGFGTTSPLAAFDIRNTLTTSDGGTIAIASVSGSTSLSALVADNSGSGSLFTASKGGQTKFTLLNNGNINAYGVQNIPTTLAFSATGAQTITFPDATGTVCISTNNCGYQPSGSYLTADQYWTTSSDGKALTPINSTQDLLIGGNATTSAVFGVLGLSDLNHQTTATVSGNLSVNPNNGFGGGASLSAQLILGAQYNPSIQTTQGKTLTLGGSTTGNIQVLSKAGSAFTTFDTVNSRLGIGTAAPSSSLTVTGGDIAITDDGKGIRFLGCNLYKKVGGNLTIDTCDLELGSLTSQSSAFIIRSSGVSYFNGGSIGIGTTSPLTTLDVRGNSGTLGVASVSGTTSFASLLANNSGSGDLFTASKGGQTKFTLLNNGNINAYGVQNIPTTLAFSATGAQTITFPDATGTVCISTNNCGYQVSGSYLTADQYWTTSTDGKALTPINSTQDLLIGGNATTSAKFALIGLNGTSPVASISAQNAGASAIYLDPANNAIQTVKNQTLTIGGATTGNIVLNPLNGVGGGQILLPSGSKTNPALARSADPSTGFYFGNDYVVFAHASVPKFFFEDLTQRGFVLASNISVSWVGNADATLAAPDVFLSRSGTNTLRLSSDESNGAATLIVNGAEGIGTTSPLTTLDVRGNSGTTGVASFSGSTSFASLITDNSGSGDLFTASKGGQTKFTLLNNGNINAYGVQNIPTTLAFSATGAQTITFPDATGTVCISTNNCGYQPSGSYLTADQYWTSPSNGVLTPINSTADLLVGGQATTSAKFAFTGLSDLNNQTRATISGDLVVVPNNGFGGGASLSAQLILGAQYNPSIQTTQGKTLTIGGATTGNININSKTNSTFANFDTVNSALLLGGAAYSSGFQFISTNTSSNANFGLTSGNGNSTLYLIASGANQNYLSYNNKLTFGSTTALGGNVANRLTLYSDGVTPGASISANTSFPGLLVDNAGFGALFAASKSGQPKFTINNNGNAEFYGTANFPTTLAFSATGAQTITFPDATGTVCISTNNCSYATGTNWWTSPSNGVLSPINSTQDFLLGGQATSSAVFSVIGLAQNTSVGNHQTSASLSGNFIVFPNNGFGGKIGVGTANPVANIEVYNNNADTAIRISSKYDKNSILEFSNPDPGQTVAKNAIVSSGLGNFDRADLKFVLNDDHALTSYNINNDTKVIFKSTGVVGIGTTNTIGFVHISGGAAAGGQAALVVDQQGGATNDIFTASKSAVPKFVITATGTLLVAGGASIDTGSGVGIASGTLSLANANATGLTIGGNQLTSGITFNVDTAANFTFQKEGSAFSCSGTDKLTLTTGVLTCATDQTGGSGISYWNLNTSDGTIYPINSTADLLVGGQATTAAKFAFTGLSDINHQTRATISGDLVVVPNNGFGGGASLSAQLILGAQYNPSIQTTQGKTLTLGGTTTGNIQVLSKAGSAFTTFDTVNSRLGIGTSTPTTALNVNGTVTIDSGDIVLSTFNVIKNSTTTLVLQADGSSAISFRPGGAERALFSNNGIFGFNSTSTTNSTFDIRPNVSTGGTLSIASVSGSTARSALVAVNDGLGDLFTASKGGQTKFTLLNNGNINAYGVQNIPTTLAFSATGAQTITFPDATGTVCISTNNCGYQVSGSYLTNDPYWIAVNSGKNISLVNNTQDLLIGGNATTSAVFGVLGLASNTHQTTATVSGNLSVAPNNGYGGNILPVIDNRSSLGATGSARFKDLFLGPSSLHIQCTTGDGCGQNLDYAIGVNTTTNALYFGVNGRSGALNQVLTITEGGNLQLAGGAVAFDTQSATSLGIGTANANAITIGNSTVSSLTFNVDTAGSFTFQKEGAAFSCSGTDKLTLTAGVLTCATDQTGGSGISYWNLNTSDGTIYPINSTADLLVGGQSTTSAVFGVLGLASNTHQTTATVSGNLIVMPNNGFGGKVGIGTETPTSALHVKALAGNILELADNTQVRFQFQPDTGSGSTLLFKSGIATMESEGHWQLKAAAGNLIKMQEGGSANEIQFDPSAGAIFTGGATNLSIGTNTSTTQLVLENGGNVGIGATSPTALLDVAGAASIGGQFTFRSGTAQIQSTVNQNLTLGGSTTGNITLSPLNGITGSFIAPNTNNQVDLGTSSLAFRTLYAGTSINLGGATLQGSGGTITFPNATGNVCLSTNNCSFATGTNWWTTSSDGKALTSINSTQDLLIGGQATTSAIFAITGLGTNISTGNHQTGATLSGTLSVVPNNGYGGNATISAGLVLGAQYNPNIQTTQGKTLTLGGSTTGDIQFQPGNSSSSLYLASNGKVGIGTTAPSTELEILKTTGGGVGPTIQLTNNGVSGGEKADIDYYVSGSVRNRFQFNIKSGGNGELMYFSRNTDASLTEKFRVDYQGFFGINNTDPKVVLDVAGTSGTIGVASISGQTSFSSLLANNNGSGSLFTASKSGATKFVINNNGTFSFAGTQNVLTTIDTLNSTARTITIPVASGNDTFCLQTVGNCGGAAGFNWWQTSSDGKALSPINGTMDFLLGNNATTSAVFAVTGLADAINHQTRASISGQLIVLPNNGYGNVGIGTATPTKMLTVYGDQSGGIARIHRVSSVTNSAVGTIDFAAETTGSIADGFGPAISFSNYSGGAYNEFAEIRGIRNGSNIDGSLIFLTNKNNSLAEKVRIQNSGEVGIGTSTPISELHVTRALSQGALGKALGVFDQIENQDILAASSSGTAKFAISSAGNLILAGGASIDTGSGVGIASGTLSLANANATGLTIGGNQLTSGITFNVDTAANFTFQKEGSAFSCSGTDKLTLTTGVLTCATDQTGGGSSTNYFDQQNGLTYVGNTTTDFAIGGTSTGSAKFVFGTINGGTPTATFSGDLIINNKPTTSLTDMQKWLKTTGSAGTIGGNNSSIASISASVVYNGSLYVGTNKADSAEIYRYDGDALGTWTKVSGTTGTVGGNATTAIDMISSLTVYNGYLYAGTTETGKAEVYRYDGGSSWTQLNVTGTAGKFVTTTSINGVSSMAVFGGRLFIGTATITGAAEIYMYYGGTTWKVLNTTAGTFVATNTVKEDIVTQMVVVNNQLVVAVQRNGDADVLRWNGAVGVAGGFFALNLASTTGSYQIDGSAQTGYNEVTAMTIWNGKLVIGIRRGAGQADILMYQEPPGGAAPINSWTRLNSAAGTITSGGTASIDSVTSLAVYNGRLYAGTTEPNSAEIYRYEEAGSWTKVSQSAAGTVASGGTTSIDGISVLIPYYNSGNALFAGTNEGSSAEGYIYSSSIDQSYALKFHAGNTQAGGEQNNNVNEGSIFFVASLSANLNNKAGNTGAFVFTNSIVTNNGSYDVAEDYPTRDDTLEPGDVVSLDTNERGFVVKSNGDYDYTAIGVYSENPGLRLSEGDTNMNGGRAIPVALVGRVPVKVSTENGAINQGDPLTPSSTPGVAMKAKKSGLIIGQAMEPYDGEGVGKIMGYVKSSTYNGSIAESFMNIDLNSATHAQDILAQLFTNPTDGKSSVVTDRVIAGLEIITPSITADTIYAKNIKADHIEGLDVLSDKISDLNNKVSSISGTTDSVSLEQRLLERLASATQSAGFTPYLSSSLDNGGLSTVSGQLRVKGNGLFEGILTVLDTITTNNFITNGLSTFFGDTVFKGNVDLGQNATFGSDTGGNALIVKGQDRVDIMFDKQYEQMPVVNAAVSFDEQKDINGNTISSSALEKNYFAQGYSYIIVDKSKRGFTIVLNKKAVDNVTFTWTALKVKEKALGN